MDDACSGWCDQEDNQALAEIAVMCGFEKPQCVAARPAGGYCKAGQVGHDGPHWTDTYTWQDGWVRMEWTD
jgi:hypothetical protein